MCSIYSRCFVPPRPASIYKGPGAANVSTAKVNRDPPNSVVPHLFHNLTIPPGVFTGVDTASSHSRLTHYLWTCYLLVNQHPWPTWFLSIAHDHSLHTHTHTFTKKHKHNAYLTPILKKTYSMTHTNTMQYLCSEYTSKSARTHIRRQTLCLITLNNNKTAFGTHHLSN